MKYSQKIAQIDLLYDIGLRRGEFKKVTAKLQQQKARFKTNDEWCAAVQSVVANIRHNPMEDEIKKSAIAVSQLCPVCQKQAEPISLMRGRKAYYCSTHRAVTPAIVNEEQIFQG